MLSFSLFNFVISFFVFLVITASLFRVSVTNFLNPSLLGNLFYQTISSMLFISIVINFFLYSILESQYNFSLNTSLVSSNLVSFYFPFIYLMLLITVISIIFCLSYNVAELHSFLVYIIVILFSGISIFFVDSIVFFFFFYECLLIPSFVILYKYSKTRKAVEASYLMFFWTQFGALMLIFAFIYLFVSTNSTLFSSIELYNFSKFEINLIFLLLLVGFGVKLPLWPFYDWLPKAHVEASTNFSIFLSGVLVKFAFFGFLKCITSLNSEITFIFIFPYLLIGVIDSVLKIFHQIDIKKVIAFATVAEMHWLVLCVISGNSMLWYSGFAMLISHALMSTNSFLLVDSISRRFKTRLTTELSGINFMCPKLFLFSMINLFVFLGFPGTLFFIAEVLFFTFALDVFPIFGLILFIIIYLLMPLLFLKAWKSILFGSVNPNLPIVNDLDKSELLIFSFLNFMLVWLGVTWDSFIF